MDFFNIKENISKYTKSKKIILTTLIFITGLFLLIISSFPSFKEESVTNINEDLQIKLEERLESILASVDGVKKVNVMICFNDRGVKEYYKDESEDRDSENIKTDKKIVLTRNDGNEAPVLKREISPDIKGVSIVIDCKKRGMEKVIYSLTSKALGIDVYKIEVVINDRSK